jgi:hypothetical protein
MNENTENNTGETMSEVNAVDQSNTSIQMPDIKGEVETQIITEFTPEQEAAMPSIITELTPEQEAAMPEFVEKYTKIGTETGPIDREKAKVYASKLYTFLERDEPQVLFANGPTEAWLMTVWINHMQQNNIKIPEKVEDIVFDFDKIRKVAKGVSFVWPYLDGQMMTSWVSWVKFMQYIGVVVRVVFSD